MEIIEITHKTGLKQEAINLLNEDPLNNYIVFQNLNNPSYSIIEIDRKHGYEKQIDYNYLKTLSDIEILKQFFSHV